MGNYKFRLADMMPNAWFYKLRDMNNKGARGVANKRRTNSTPTPPKNFMQSPQPPKIQPNRASYHYTTRAEAEKKLRSGLPSSPVQHKKATDTSFPIDPPRKSKKSSRRKAAKSSSKVSASSVPSACSYRAWKSSELMPEIDNMPSSCDCRIISSEADIIIDIGTDTSTFVNKKIEEFDLVSECELPPILTKPVKKEEKTEKNNEEQPKRSSVRVRGNSPRIASRRVQVYRRHRSTRNGLSESFAVVKSSSNPRKDFRDSMMEMIVENDMRSSKDLEELLACYLSLNSNEYHDVIVKVFEQIWFDLKNIKL